MLIDSDRVAGRDDPALLQLPPHNLEAEEGVLGSMLMDNECIDDVLAEIKASDLYRDKHQTIIRAIETVFLSGQPVDVLTLSEHLRKRGELERVGGIDVIFGLVNAVPHSANARHYAGIVRQNSVARQVIALCQSGLGEAYSNSRTAEELVAFVERGLLKIGQGQTANEPVPFSDAVAEAYRAILDRRDRKLSGLSSGFPGLDFHLGGFAGGRLIVLAARPAMGKTALVMNMIESIAETGAACLIFSREMAGAELALRAIAGKANIPTSTLQQAHYLKGHDLPKIDDAARQLSPLPIFVEDSSDPSISALERVARRYVARSEIKFIAVDYLQLLDSADEKRGRTRQEVVAEISRRLKGLARQLQVPVMALSQLNRGVEDREDKRPKVSDIRESGAVEQDADQILMLHRPEKYDPADKPGIAQIIIGKNRHGGTGLVEVNFNGPLTRFFIKLESEALSFDDAELF